MMWDGFGGMGWGWIGFGIVHMLLFWVVLILAIVALLKWLAGSSGSASGGRALEILKERYAKGELTREQFEQMKREL